jgi:hypothetical protein
MPPEAVEVEERRAPMPPLGGAGTVLREQQKADTKSLVEWFDESMGGHADCRIKIERKEPKMIGSRRVGGALETLDSKPEDLEEYIRETWGGGIYQIQLLVPNGKGGHQYGKAKTFTMAGETKWRGVIVTEESTSVAAASSAGSDNLVERAMDVTEKMAAQERARANRLEEKMDEIRAGGGKTDLSQLEFILAPLREQLTALRTQNETLQAKVLELTTKPPPSDPLRDRILEQSFSGESKALKDQHDRYEERLDKMRDNHAAELRIVRENHSADVKRMEDRHDRAIADLTRNFDRQITELTKSTDRAIADLKENHQRELRAQEKAHATEVKTLEAANEAAKIALKNEADRVKGDLTATKSELGTLRERKEKSPVEQMSELVKLKESMDKITGGGEEEPKEWYEKIADAAAPIAERIAERVWGGDNEEEAEEEQPQQQAQQPRLLPAINAPVRNPQDGMIYIHRGRGQYEGPYTDEEFEQLRKQVMARRQQVAAQRSQRRRIVPPRPDVAPANDEAAAPEAETDEALAETADESPQGKRAVAKPNPRPQLAQGTQIQPKPVRQLTPARPHVAQPAAPKAKAGRPPNAAEVKLAVEFLESAFSNGKKPEDIARTATAVMPGPVLRYLKAGGVDTILANVANFKGGSPLTTQLGRKFVRDIAKHIGGAA